jgi:prepilin-type N-terminal cleavage/methylation domain-containing protein
MKTKEQGLSLVELLVALAILAVGIVPLIRVLVYGLDTGNRANKMTIVTNLARDMAEEMRSQSFSEEFVYPDPSCSVDTAYPQVVTTAQCFGREGGSEDESFTVSKGGRIKVFDDIDDYDGWCRGEDCIGGFKPLETYDGFQYNGQQGYPFYHGFTRRVRVHNIDAADAYVTEFRADPFSDYTSTDSTQLIKRYDFDNWSTITIGQRGLTPLKRIEVTVTYNGPVTKGIEVIDVSYAVMPEM